MASANYVTWYLVELNNVFAESSHFKLCKTKQECAEYVAELCDEVEMMQVTNIDRPSIMIRIDRHERPCGPIM